LLIASATAATPKLTADKSTVNSSTAADACYWTKRYSTVLGHFVALRNF